MESNIKQLIDNFKERRPLIEEFNVVVFNIIKKMLDEENYKYQISYRTKTIGSLNEKLERKERDGKIYKTLKDIKDLAGVRIIFYFERHKNKFIKKIEEEISGDVILEKKEKPSGYKAKHVIISFGPKRLELSEYKKFEKIKCELQLTSILYHAWSEIEHDLIYKNKDNPQNVKKQLNKIMKNYIKKALLDIENLVKLIKK